MRSEGAATTESMRKSISDAVAEAEAGAIISTAANTAKAKEVQRAAHHDLMV